MAIQSTPHTESQQNRGQTETELTPNQIAERIERDGESGLYANMDGAQTGTNRSEHAMNVKGPKHNVEPAASADTGAISSGVGDGEAQGITNHSQHAEHDGQVKVMKQREDAMASSGEESDRGQPVRDSVREGGELPGKKESKAETVEISGMRGIR